MNTYPLNNKTLLMLLHSVCERTNSIPLLFVGVENDSLVGGIVVSLELVAEDSLTCITVK